MAVYAIADLHLDFAKPEGREKYAERWREHAAKIEREWCAVVTRMDLVLVPGDISMARRHRDLQPDFAWLERLPGRKVLSPGNHDRWWNSAEAIRPMLRRSLAAVEGDALRTHEVVVCGARGAPIPSEDDPAAGLLFKKEMEILRKALEAGASLRVGDEPFYALWHHPPFDQHGRPSEVVELFQEHRVTHVVYGHLHNQGQWSSAAQGLIEGVRYHCVAADAIGFRPLRVG